MPWIDKDMGNGQSREEWKGQAETNKILGRGEAATSDPGRRRLRARRRDALPQPGADDQAARDVPLDEIEGMLASANDWVKVVPNEREATWAS